MTIRKIVIEYCTECPHFNNYEDINSDGECNLSDKSLANHFPLLGKGKDIPEWCELLEDT